MDQIINKVKFISLKLLGSTTLGWIGIRHYTCANFHMAIVMGIQITIHDHGTPLDVFVALLGVLAARALGTPWHGSASLVKPAGVCFVVVAWGFATDSRVGVETVMAVFAGRAAGLACAFAGVDDVVGVKVAGAWRSEVAMAFHGGRRVDGEGG